MTLEEFLTHARAFAHLGDAVGDQLMRVAEDDSTIDDQNPNAMDLAADRFLRPLYRDMLEDVGNESDEGLAELRDDVAALLGAIHCPNARRSR